MQSPVLTLLVTCAALALASSAAMAAGENAAAPKASATAAAKTPAAAPKEGAPKPAQKAKAPKPVDINTASVEQLEKVPGLDKAHAMKIVSNRPYPTRSWLVTKGILSEAKYAEVKGYLVATPVAPPKEATAKK